MHITSIEICGFKSYKDAKPSEPFSPKINAVLGANGSGKSNFFHAIRFVLNDAFVNMRAEDRQSLLHEGAGNPMLSAYVEVVFDNSDGRFPIDRDEVRLRRTIGKNKDEYHLDKKHVNKSEVINLLESAGFSRANPYYIVQQGKIMAMSTMKDHERLELLKEIGGTKVYEDRRHESLKLMQETESRRSQIEQVMAVIEEKLSSLDEERKELAEYQQLDRSRRCLEYAMYDKELAAARHQLENVDEQHRQKREAASKAVDDVNRAHADAKAVEKDIRDVSSELEEKSKHKSELLRQKDELLASSAKSEATVNDLEARIQRNATLAGSAQNELQALQGRIGETKEQLEMAKSEVATSEAHQTDLRTQLDSSEQRLQLIFQKQGRGSEFNSQAERDAWVRAEMAKLESTLKQEEKRVQQISRETAELNSSLMDLAQSIGDKEAECRKCEEDIAGADRAWASLKLERDGLQNQRNAAYRAESELEAKIRSLDGELRKRRANMETHVARDIIRGLQGLERVVSDHSVQGVYGQLIDLIDAPPQLNTAVEVTAGNSLYHVVVENADVALKCTDLLNRGKLGRVTFMPLNTLRPPQISYPTEYGSDVVPLFKKIKCDERFIPAIQQVFGRTVLCRNMDIATQVSRTAELNCVTIDGDQVSKRGAMTGGFHDFNASRLTNLRQVKECAMELGAVQRERQEALEKASMVDQEVTRINGELAKLDVQRGHLRSVQQAQRDEMKHMKSEQADKNRDVEKRERTVNAAQSNVASIKLRLSNLGSELGTELKLALSPEEQKELKCLQPAISAIKESLKEAAKRLAKHQRAMQALQTTLDGNLLRRKNELESALNVDDLTIDRVTVEVSRSEFQGYQASLAAVQHDLVGVEAAMESMSERLRELTKRREAVGSAEARRDMAVADESKALETLTARHATLTQRIEDIGKKIRDLGTLPADAFDKYKDKSTKELQRLLQKVVSDLSKYGGNVNRKALDQYMSFTEQREELARRKSEMDRSEAKILELIKVLDMRKDEAIERTFKGVAKYFAEVFSELVPGGRGDLVMQKRHPGSLPDPEAEGAEAHDAASEKYSGVKVRVAFVPGGETMALKQLSGGQKTLVALALIFSIQRCDPAPFYLFDEIDAALDPQYRTTVAKMLRKQANDPKNPAQFIVTTFHPQIVGEADMLYGVAHTNRVSSVYAIRREDALIFLQVAEEQGQAPDAAQPRDQDSEGGDAMEED